ncbi:MAG: selenocysteine-specific translation elongation factor [Armatimonadota bacterium]|nr:selenocysteine-specific translation elongation factor [Armatimonadota bacterium]
MEASSSTKHIIVGTAGHVDHGKTTLIKALTGIDTDRLKEEKQRGMTIDLGFASLTLPSGRTVGIVDVPGHERFLKNMLAGASGVDLALLVIAADEGVMPQTKEHLEILQLLETKKGVIALTKCDMVDDDWIEIVEEDIRAQLVGTFLEDAPIVRVSSLTSAGISELAATLDVLCDEVEEHNISVPFRLPIDRVFTLTGFGTVITGTLVSGTMRVGDAVEVLPQKIQTRARQIQVHGRKLEEVTAGARVAVNLAGVETSDIERGSVCAPPGYLKPSQLIAAHARILKDEEKPLRSKSRLRLHIGTAEIIGRVTVLDKEQIEAGEDGFIQFKAEEPFVAARGDRFVLRSYSPMRVIGGGIVIEPNAVRRKRFDAAALESLSAKLQGDPRELVEQALLSGGAKSIAEIVKSVALPEGEVNSAIEELISHKRAVKLESGALMSRVTLSTITERVLGSLAAFHKANPLKPGQNKEELRTVAARGLDQKSFNALLSLLRMDGKVAVTESIVKLAGHDLKLSPEQEKALSAIEAAYRQAKFNPPSVEEAYAAAGGRDSKDVLDLLVSQEELLKIAEGLYFHSDTITAAEGLIRDYVAKNGPMSVSAFRDITGSSRRFIIPLLEYFDYKRVTRRVGDQRVLVK